MKLKKWKRVITTGMSCLTMSACALCATSCDAYTERKMQLITWGVVSGIAMGEFAYMEAFFNNGFLFLESRGLGLDGYEVGTLGIYKDKKVEIPSTYKGKPVLVLTAGAWKDLDMQTLTIPESIQKTNAWSMPDCDELMEIIVDENNRYFKSVEGNIYSKDGTVFVQYAGGKKAENFRIPDGVVEIDFGAFAGCHNLQTVNFPVGVERIEDQAFMCCNGLTNVYLAEGVTTIGIDSFSRCPKLKQVSFPDTLEEIGSWAFYHCKALEYVNIPDSVTTLQGRAFSDCINLKEIVFGNGIIEIDSNAFSNCSSLKSVYYHGTEAEWEMISIEEGSEVLLSARRYYYSEIKPTEEGKFWYYDKKGKIVEW